MKPSEWIDKRTAKIFEEHNLTDNYTNPTAKAIRLIHSFNEAIMEYLDLLAEQEDKSITELNEKLID